MYKELKEWLNISVTRKPFIKFDGAGDKSFESGVDLKCYMQGKFTIVTNMAGVEVVSKCQLYIDGTIPIKYHDEFIVEDEEHSIIAIEKYYDEKGALSIWVVFL